MPLSQEQIAFEKDRITRWHGASTRRELDAWMEFYAEDATFAPTGIPLIKGRSTIRKYFEQMLKNFSKNSVEDVTVTIDERNSRIIVISNTLLAFKDDPEQKMNKFRTVIVVDKPLGVNAEQMTKEEVINDSTPIVMRMMELGMDPRSFAFVE